MGFGGSVAAMITSLKNNTRAKRKTLFDRKYGFKEKEADDKLLAKKATPKQLSKVKEKIIQQQKNETYKNLIIIVFSILLIILLMIYFNKNFNGN